MNYEKSMKRCIELALNGRGEVSPNPLVGCVVYDKDGNVVSEGWHEKYGENHAERNALLKLKHEEARGGTLVVNLEPCSHFGHTPPCADLIIEKGIKKVVLGMRDVNPIVAGNGIKNLQNAGIEVVEGVLEDECKKLNEVFIKNMTQHKTFVAIKTAATLDGKTASKTGSSKWITGEAARAEVKVIRKTYDAIMTSSATVITDNPTMEHKTKVILDRRLRTDYTSNIYKSGRIIVFHDEALDTPSVAGIEFIKAPVKNSEIELEFVFERLYDIGIMSVLVEAGGHLNGSALEYADKIYHFFAPKVMDDNLGLSCFDSAEVVDINQCREFFFESVKFFGDDILLTYYPMEKNS